MLTMILIIWVVLGLVNIMIALPEMTVQANGLAMSHLVLYYATIIAACILFSPFVFFVFIYNPKKGASNE